MDKLPSLSSLLLAGLVCGSNCTKDKKSGNAKEVVRATSEEAAKLPEVKAVSNLVEKLGVELFNARHKVWALLMDGYDVEEFFLAVPIEIPNLVDLKKEKAGIFKRDVNLAQFSKEAAEFSARLTAHDLPELFGDDFKQSIDMLASYSNSKYPRAAFEAKATTVDFMNKVIEAIKNIKDAEFGATLEEQGNLASKYLVPLQDKVGELFVKDKSFFERAAVLQSGDRLARFLTDQDVKTTTLKNNSYGVPAILNADVKIDLNALSKVNENKIDTNGGASFVLKRGLGTQNVDNTGQNATPWIVSGTGDSASNCNTMPSIAMLCPIAERAFTVTALDAVTEMLLQQAPAGADAPSLPAGQFDVMPIAISSGDKVYAQIRVDKTFGQLLLTLFTLTSNKDPKEDALAFMGLDLNKDRKAFKFKEDKDKVFERNYKNLIEKAKDQKEAFAKYLGSYIENNEELKAMFPSLDLNDVNKEVYKEVSDLADEDTVGNTLNDDHPLYKVYHALVGKVFGSSYIGTKSRADIEGVVGRIAACNTLNTAQISYEYKFYIKLINLLHGKQTDLLAKDTWKKLKHGINELIREASSGLLVKKVGSQYLDTAATEFIQACLLRFDNALHKKNKNLGLSYDKIEQELVNFSIQNIALGFSKVLIDLQSMLGIDVTGLLNKRGKIAPAQDLVGMRDNPSVVAKLDDVRKGYQAGHFKAAPVAEAAPAA